MNLTCPKCGHKFETNAKVRAHCPKCRNILPRIDTLIKKGIIGTENGIVGTKNGTKISDDFMSGSLIDALKKTGLDPMKNGQIRDAISSILETDEYKIAFADAVEKTHLSPIRLAKKILRDWLKKEEYV